MPGFGMIFDSLLLSPFGAEHGGQLRPKADIKRESECSMQNTLSDLVWCGLSSNQ